MPKYPFEHDGPVFILGDDNSETAYYARDGKKYKRICQPLWKGWEHTREQEIDPDTWWMVVACIERKPRYAPH
jgi:hypothetical protein